jgi:hypothetical protein
MKERIMEYKFTDQERLKIIVQKSVEQDLAWFKEQDINFKLKSGFFILDYGKKLKTEFNRLCRGLIIRQPTTDSFDLLSLIVCFPFERFFNYQEPHAHSVDFAKSYMLEKMDGSCISVFFPERDPNKPAWSTRQMFNRHKEDVELMLRSIKTDEEFYLLPLVGEYVKKIDFSQVDLDYTYVFEFIHSEASVLTEYSEDEYGLYLINVRNLNSFNEVCENTLNELFPKLGAKRPQMLDPISDMSQAFKRLEIAAQNKKMFEGYIFRDVETGHRVKFKDEKYVKTHHNIDNTSRTLVPKIILGEIEEYLSYFPFLSKKVNNIQNKKMMKIKEICLEIKQFHKFGTKKELAFRLKGVKIPDFDKSVIFKYYMHDLSDERLEEAVSIELDKLGKKSANNFLEVIGIK